MLTPEQLDEIKAHLNLTRKMDSDKVQLCTNVATLLAELDRLQLALKAKDAVLAQFSDSENWITPSEEWPMWDWHMSSVDPIDLANQALNEGHE